MSNPTTLYMSKSKCKNTLKTISLISIPSCDNVLCTFKGQDVWVSLLSLLDHPTWMLEESIFNIEWMGYGLFYRSDYQISNFSFRENRDEYSFKLLKYRPTPRKHQTRMRRPHAKRYTAKVTKMIMVCAFLKPNAVHMKRICT